MHARKIIAKYCNVKLEKNASPDYCPRISGMPYPITQHHKQRSSEGNCSKQDRQQLHSFDYNTDKAW